MRLRGDLGSGSLNIDEFHVDRALPSPTSTCWHAGYAYLLTHRVGRQGILETSLNPHHTPSGLYGEAMWPDILADRGWKRARFQVFKAVGESSEDSFKLVEVCRGRGSWKPTRDQIVQTAGSGV